MKAVQDQIGRQVEQRIEGQIAALVVTPAYNQIETYQWGGLISIDLVQTPIWEETYLGSAG